MLAECTSRTSRPGRLDGLESGARRTGVARTSPWSCRSSSDIVLKYRLLHPATCSRTALSTNKQPSIGRRPPAAIDITQGQTPRPSVAGTQTLGLKFDRYQRTSKFTSSNRTPTTFVLRMKFSFIETVPHSTTPNSNKIELVFDRVATWSVISVHKSERASVKISSNNQPATTAWTITGMIGKGRSVRSPDYSDCPILASGLSAD